ncbi:MAG: GNAT family N-acetyltransferase [Gemmiger sp.]
MKLETERLELILLDARQLRLWLDDLPVLEKELQCVYDAETMDAAFARILRGQARAAEQDPYNLCWRSFWWMVEKNGYRVVGSADFKSPPDKTGQLEIGYGLGVKHWHRGYMTETVQAMCAWALAQDGVSAVIAETEKDNVASQRVLQRCGFSLYRREATLWWRLSRQMENK